MILFVSTHVLNVTIMMGCLLFEEVGRAIIINCNMTEMFSDIWQDQTSFRVIIKFMD